MSTSQRKFTPSANTTQSHRITKPSSLIFKRWPNPMRVLGFVCSLGLIGSFGLASSTVAAEIYKITEPDGRVVYSDRAPRDEVSQVEVVSIPTAHSAANSRNSNTASRQQNSSDRNSSQRSDRYTNYTVEITSPAEARAYRKPAQTVDIIAKTTPSIGDSDKVIISVDGHDVATGLSASIPTIDLIPGEHTITVAVVNSEGVVASDSMTFYVILNNAVMRQNKKMAQQMQAYNKLPWYKKIQARLSPSKTVTQGK